jgi:hypothetical protein
MREHTDCITRPPNRIRIHAIRSFPLSSYSLPVTGTYPNHPRKADNAPGTRERYFTSIHLRPKVLPIFGKITDIRQPSETRLSKLKRYVTNHVLHFITVTISQSLFHNHYFKMNNQEFEGMHLHENVTTVFRSHPISSKLPQTTHEVSTSECAIT